MKRANLQRLPPYLSFTKLDPVYVAIAIEKASLYSCRTSQGPEMPHPLCLNNSQSCTHLCPSFSMSSAHSSSQIRILSPGVHEMYSSNLEQSFQSQSQEEEAIVASIDELSKSTYRSPSQQSAIETLRDFDDSKIFDLLSALRLPGHAHHTSYTGLSSEQDDALSELKTCPDSLILLWLRSSRGWQQIPSYNIHKLTNGISVASSHFQNSHISDISTTQRPAINGSMTELRRPLKTSLNPSSTLPIYFPAFKGKATHNTMTKIADRHHILHNSPQQFSAQEASTSRVSDVQPYWCINMFCDRHHHHYIYTTCDGWKRHMKEHETFWPCMPHGPLEAAGAGVICALCCSVNPNKSHMAGHSIGKCGDRSDKLRRVSRRVNLKKHLRQSHVVSEDFARSLANKWKTTLRKKHFACGFCVCIFSTIHEQLNHIDANHFKKGRQITEWSATNVILGLLLSPRVASWFQWMLLSDPYAKDRYLHWEWHMVEDLQRRLEMAEDAAETLAFDAYKMLTFNSSRQHVDGQQLPRSLLGLNCLGQSEVEAPSFAASADLPEKHGGKIIEELPQGLENALFPDEHDVAAPSTSYSISSHGSPITQSDTSEAQPSIDYQNFHSSAPANFPTVSTSNVLLSQPIYPPAHTTSTSSISELSSTSKDDNSGTNTRCRCTPSTTTGTSHSTAAAYMLREQPEIYHGHAQEEETAATATCNIADLSRSSGSRGGPLLFDTCDPRDLIKKPR